MDMERKYRGINKGRWVYGYYVGQSVGVAYIMNPKDVEYDMECIDTSICSECVASTVGQYTGMVDSYCQDIYDGDVLRLGKQMYLVAYEDGGFVLKGQDETKPLSVIKGTDSEIVGNIHVTENTISVPRWDATATINGMEIKM